MGTKTKSIQAVNQPISKGARAWGRKPKTSSEGYQEACNASISY
jgi:hypothetical protein